MKSLLISVLMFSGYAAVAAENGYPRPDLLVEPQALSRPEVAGQFVILDARDRKSFDESRIPHARWVDAAAWAKDFDPSDPAGWSARIGDLGIAPGSKVVVYDDNSAKDAARMWWILRYWGVRDVRLLNGGWSAWQKAGLPVESGPATSPAPVKFIAAPRPNRLATKQQLLESLTAHSMQIVDARSEKEFCGLDKEENNRGGAIPGAKHLEWSDLIDKDTQRFKGPDELRRLFQEAGIDLEKPTATHCQSGGRASVMAFGMELMGAPHVSNYYPGWSEWGNADDTPIVTSEPTK